MNRKKLKTLCLFICVLILSPVSFCGQFQKTHASNESVQNFDEVRNPEEVRRAAESKPYHQTIVEGKRGGKSQIRTDLENLRRKIAEIRPKWLTKKVLFSLGTVLFFGAVAIYMINVIKRREKMNAKRKLNKIQEEAQKYR